MKEQENLKEEGSVMCDITLYNFSVYKDMEIEKWITLLELLELEKIT